MAGTTPARGDVPLFGSDAAGLRLELVVAGDDTEDPFVPLDDTGRLARVLLGRIVMGDATTLQFLAIKLQRNVYAPSQPPPGQRELTNPQVESMWREEREKLLGSACPEAIRILDPGEALWRQRPVTYCRKIRAYFHPPCPRCAGPLVDCRDDDMLRRSGLPSFSESLARYLYCPACCPACAPRAGAQAGSPPAVFYAYAAQPGERPEAGIVVRRRAELYRDYRGLLEKGPVPLQESPGPPERVPATGSPTGSPTGFPTGFPCRSCTHRRECYPSEAAPGRPIPAEGRLVPLSYHETHVLALEVPHLRLDELSDLLAGRGWEEIRRRAVETSGSSGRARILEGLDHRLAGGLRRVFRGDSTGKDAMEVLWLKLTAFLQVCRGVRAYHALWKEPLLRLHPASIAVVLPDTGSDIPAEWSFQSKLGDLGGQWRLEIPAPLPALPGDPGESWPAEASDRAARLLLVPGDCPREYISALALDPPPGTEEPARITIRRAQGVEGAEDARAGTGGTRGPGATGGTCGARLDIEATTRTRLRAYRPGDVARLLLASPPAWLLDTQLWGRIRRVSADGIFLEAVLPEGVGPPAGASFPLVLDGHLALYKRLGPACDLYALGMTLLRMVLCDDERSFVDVEETVRRIIHQLASSFPERDRAVGVDPAKVLGQIEWQLEAAGDIFSQHRLARASGGASSGTSGGASSGASSGASGRAPDGAGVPQSIWFDVLCLGFRLLSHLRGFGYASDHAGFPDHDGDAARADHPPRPGHAPALPEAILDAVLDDAALLCARLHVELFAEPGRNLEIREVCDELIAEITRRSLGQDEPGQSDLGERSVAEGSPAGLEGGGGTAIGPREGPREEGDRP